MLRRLEDSSLVDIPDRISNTKRTLEERVADNLPRPSKATAHHPLSKAMEVLKADLLALDTAHRWEAEWTLKDTSES